jgi:hypothetical protein
LRASSSKADWIKASLALIGNILENSEGLGGAAALPHWYRRMTHINLPDARVGYAVADVCEAGWKLQTCSR